jgi:hypothetical protein
MLFMSDMTLFPFNGRIGVKIIRFLAGYPIWSFLEDMFSSLRWQPHAVCWLISTEWCFSSLLLWETVKFGHYSQHPGTTGGKWTPGWVV